jgi:hypothetical protein
MIINPQVSSGVTLPQGFNPTGYMRPQQPMNGGPVGAYQGAQPPSGSINFANMANSQPTMAMPGAGVRPTPGVAPQPTGFVQHNTGGVGAFPSRMQGQMALAPPMQSQMARIAALRGQG